MKLFKSILTAMLGLAFVMTSCSDDKYEVDQKLTGAYFAGNQATVLSFNNKATSYTLKVYRTENSPTDYNVTSTDESGLFSIPSSISFAPEQYVTDLVINYDPTKTEEGKEYFISIILGNEVNVGRNALNFTVVVEAPVVTELFLDGLGSYTYDFFLTGTQTKLPVTITYVETDPKNVVWTVGNLGDPDVKPEDQNPWMYLPDSGMPGINLQITSNEYDAESEDDINVSVPTQFTGYADSNGNIYITDINNFYNGLGANDNYLGTSYYTPTTGTFTLDVVYCLPELGPGYWFGSDAIEYLQMDGFPDYEAYIEYEGLFTDRTGAMTAEVYVYTGEDVELAQAVMVEGNDPTIGLYEILTGGTGVVEVDTPGETNISFPVTKPGTYTVVLVTYDNEGEPAKASYDTFEITIGSVDDSADWQDLGYADYIDGWIMPAFKFQDGTPVDPFDYPYSITVEKYIGSTPQVGDVIRLVQPYGPDFPLANSNAYPAKRNLQFNLEAPYAAVMVQPSGFGASSWGTELQIGDIAGNWMVEYGDTPTSAAEYLIDEDDEESVTYYEDDIITVQLPLFCNPTTGQFGYTWQTIYPTMVYLPEADASSLAKAKAAKVAKPNLKGARAVSGNIVNKFAPKETSSGLKVNTKFARKFNGNFKPAFSLKRK